MRLICPNCGTEYDVADDPIPENGQDVQCSNCNHTWFQFQNTSVPANTEDASAPDTRPGRRPLYPTFSNILNENATREKQMRAPATTALRPTRKDTIFEPTNDGRQTRGRIAEMAEARAERQKLATALRIATAHRAAKRPKLMPAQHLHRVPQQSEDTNTIQLDMPSMDDSNTSLRTLAQVSELELTHAEQPTIITRHGFRRGFVFVLVSFGVLFGPYVFADQITANIPQTTDAMGSYVRMVDGWRLTLNQNSSALGAMIADVTLGPDDQPDQN